MMVKMTVDFHDVIDYTKPKLRDSWTSENCMLCSTLRLRGEQFFLVQRGTVFAVYIYGELVRVFFAQDMLQGEGVSVKHL